MITTEDKQKYEKYSKNRRVNRIFYSLAKNIYVKPLRKIIVNLKLEGLENIASMLHKSGKRCIIAPYHCLSIEEPLMGEIFDDLIGKPHAIMTHKVFSKHKLIYSTLELVPFNTEVDSGFRQDYNWSMQKSKEWLNINEPILIFSDGETQAHVENQVKNEKKEILPLAERPNSCMLSKLSFETNSPILPVCPYSKLEHEKRLYEWSNWKSWFYLLKNIRIPYGIKILEPIYPRDFTNPGAMRKELRERQIKAYQNIK
jgi:hypothetical protein